VNELEKTQKKIAGQPLKLISDYPAIW